MRLPSSARLSRSVPSSPAAIDTRNRCSRLPSRLSSEEDIVPPEDAMRRRYDQELRLLSVGRIEEEKNPLLLADVLARLHEIDPRWRLIVCGEGPLEGQLQRRLQGLGLARFSELRGYVPFGPDLLALYGASHAFLHVSWTEGLPQVLFEAFALGLPTIATDVGGVRDALNGRVRLIPPNDVDAAARELTAVARDPKLRARLIGAGHASMLRRKNSVPRGGARGGAPRPSSWSVEQTTQAPSSKHSIAATAPKTRSMWSFSLPGREMTNSPRSMSKFH